MLIVKYPLYELEISSEHNIFFTSFNVKVCLAIKILWSRQVHVDIYYQDTKAKPVQKVKNKTNGKNSDQRKTIEIKFDSVTRFQGMGYYTASYIKLMVMSQYYTY